MLVYTVKCVDGKMVTTEKIVDTASLTSDCWLIQFSGLEACEECDVCGTDNCSGQEIRQKLLAGE